MGTLKLNTTQQFRRDNAAVWTEKNPVLLEGEPGLELDTGKFKIGDGVTSWNILPYFSIDSESKADVDLSNIRDDVFLAKANQAGIGGGSASSVNGVEQIEGDIALSAKNIPIDSINGMVASNVQDAIAANFQSVVDGKKLMETAIIDKGGTVSKTSDVATFEELKSGIDGIEISIAPPPVYHTVSVDNPERGGIISVTKTSAAIGEEIGVIVVPSTGYALDETTLKQNNTVIINNTFLMPNKDVIVTGSFDDDNLVYTLSADGTYYSVGQKKSTVTINKIPAYKNGKPVKKIQPSGFRDNATISTIELPETIEEIGSYAFYNCGNLSVVGWSKNLKVIDSYGFYNTKVENFDLPVGIKRVGDFSIISKVNADYNLPYTIENYSVKAAQDTSYAGTSSSKVRTRNLTIDIAAIPEGAFNNHSIENLKIGSHVRSIGKDAFRAGTVCMSSVKIEEGVTDISEFCFVNHSLAVGSGTVIIPSSVVTTGAGSFDRVAKRYILKGKTAVPKTWRSDWVRGTATVEFQP